MQKSVIITGASGGLGLAVTEKFLKEGYYVFALTEPDKKDQEKRILELPNAGQYAAVHPVDLFDPSAIASFKDEVDTRKFQLEAIIMLVGGFGMGKLADTDEAAIDKMVQINFKSAFHTTKGLVSLLEHQETPSRLFYVGAMPVFNHGAGANLLAYALSKGMVVQFAHQMAQSYKDTPIKTAVIAPDLIDTPPNREAMPKADFDKWVKPQDIAYTIYDYCQDHTKTIFDPVIQLYGNP